jgi:hypothetical protein
LPNVVSQNREDEDPEENPEENPESNPAEEKIGIWLPREFSRPTSRSTATPSTTGVASPRIELSDDRKANLLARLRELDIQDGVQVERNFALLSPRLHICEQSHICVRRCTRICRREFCGVCLFHYKKVHFLFEKVEGDFGYASQVYN